MDFNIASYIQKIKQQQESQLDTTTQLLLQELREYVPQISAEHIQLQGTRLFLRNIPPAQKTFVKIRKPKIIQSLKKHNIVVRDII